MSNANGFLLPPWYEAYIPSQDDMNVASMIWGFSLSCGVFTASKAARHSWKAYETGKLRNTYIVMVWAEWIVSVTISILGWPYITPDLSILPGFWIFFAFLILWTVQVQCIAQIIINRVRLLMDDQRRADHLKWGAAILVGLINISVFIIWIPARLQISERWILINEIWDRIEKVLLATLDFSLNLYFVHLVRSTMIANGLTKYRALYRFNMFMIVISISLDVILIGMMSLPNTAVYIQFHPLVYLVKLCIEMTMAELIVKVVKASNHLNVGHVRSVTTHSAPFGIFIDPSDDTAGCEAHMPGQNRPDDAEAAAQTKGRSGEPSNGLRRMVEAQVFL